MCIVQTDVTTDEIPTKETTFIPSFYITRHRHGELLLQSEKYGSRGAASQDKGRAEVAQPHSPNSSDSRQSHQFPHQDYISWPKSPTTSASTTPASTTPVNTASASAARIFRRIFWRIQWQLRRGGQLLRLWQDQGQDQGTCRKGFFPMDGLRAIITWLRGSFGAEFQKICVSNKKKVNKELTSISTQFTIYFFALSEVMEPLVFAVL